MALLVTILFCVLCGQVLIGGSALVWVFIADINDERKRPHDGHDRAAEREARWYRLHNRTGEKSGLVLKAGRRSRCLAIASALAGSSGTALGRIR